MGNRKRKLFFTVAQSPIPLFSFRCSLFPFSPLPITLTH